MVKFQGKKKGTDFSNHLITDSRDKSTVTCGYVMFDRALNKKNIITDALRSVYVDRK